MYHFSLINFSFVKYIIHTKPVCPSQDQEIIYLNRMFYYYNATITYFIVANNRKICNCCF